MKIFIKGTIAQQYANKCKFNVILAIIYWGDLFILCLWVVMATAATSQLPEGYQPGRVQPWVIPTVNSSRHPPFL
jgi:hypothetical protein